MVALVFDGRVLLPLARFSLDGAAAFGILKKKLRWLHALYNTADVYQISCILTQDLLKYLQ